MNYTTISKLSENPSVTISLGMPNDEKDNDKYSIVLKNLLQHVRKELSDHYLARDYKELSENLDELENEFIPSLKEESYVYFFSNSVKEKVVLPFLVENEYHVGSKFITKKIVRKWSDNHHYYVLTLNDTESRLLEYHKETLIREVKDNHFPLLNKGYWTSDRLLNSMGSVRSNYQREFYKLIDSELQSYLNQDPHPIVLAGVSENCAIYKQIANRNELIVGEINGNFTSEKGATTIEIGKKAADLMQAYVESEKQQLIASLDQFNSQGRLETDLVTIYMAAVNGRAQKLVVDSQYYQEAILKDGQVELTEVDVTKEDYVEDIVNEIIYQVMRYGGDVIFSTAEDLQHYAPMVLRTRY